MKTQFFGCQNENKSQNEECHISLSSLFNFQSIDIKTWKFFNISIFRKNNNKKNAKIEQKINVPQSDKDR